MNIDDYIKHIKDVLSRIDDMFTGVYVGDNKQEIESICIQLRFILSYAESGRSFKQGLLERKRYIFKTRMDLYRHADRVLRDALRTVYYDLDAHDYSVGTLSRKMGEYYFDLINNKDTYHEELVKERTLDDEHYVSYRLADICFYDLFGANYYSLWIKHGIKNLQYFFLVNLFSYVGQTVPAIDPFPHPEALQLTNDIIRISKFYETDEAEGTHMYLNPVEIKELDGRTHLVDLKGNIIASGQP